MKLINIILFLNMILGFCGVIYGIAENSTLLFSGGIVGIGLSLYVYNKLRS